MQEFPYLHCPSYYEEDNDICLGEYYSEIETIEHTPYKTEAHYLYEKCLTCPKRVKEANG